MRGGVVLPRCKRKNPFGRTRKKKNDAILYWYCCWLGILAIICTKFADDKFIYSHFPCIYVVYFYFVILLFSSLSVIYCKEFIPFSQRDNNMAINFWYVGLAKVGNYEPYSKITSAYILHSKPLSYIFSSIYFQKGNAFWNAEWIKFQCL